MCNWQTPQNQEFLARILAIVEKKSIPARNKIPFPRFYSIDD
jgi:hypothetical protein